MILWPLAGCNLQPGVGNGSGDQGASPDANTSNSPDTPNDDSDNITLSETVIDAEDFGDFKIVAEPGDGPGDWELSVVSELGRAGDFRYLWNVGSEFALEGAAQSITFNESGVHVVTLTAYDLSGARVFTLTAEIDADTRNAAPVAVAGPDLQVDEGEVVVLDGSDSYDPDDDDLTYAWEQAVGPTVMLSSADMASASFTAPFVQDDAVLTFSLTVDDGELSHVDTIVVHVRGGIDLAGAGVNADAGEDQRVSELDPVQLDGTGSTGPAGSGPLSFEWNQVEGPAVSLSSRFSSTPIFTAPAVDVDTDLVFELIVSAGTAVGSDEVTVTVLDNAVTGGGGGGGGGLGDDTGGGGDPGGGNEGCITNIDCDDGVFCNGVEVCQNGTCMAGVQPNCNDNIACTTDTCDEASNSCLHEPDHGMCDNGLFCDGEEVCDLVQGCSAGSPVDCSDGIDCTVDSCRESDDTCVHTPDDGRCQNNQFCDGVEVCNAGEGCKFGPPPCTDQLCNENSDSCETVDCFEDADCNDGLFCNGVETCQNNVCVGGSPVNCDDGVSCTIDGCNENNDSCINEPNHSACDNGLYCDGAETCNATLGCQAGTAVVCDDGVDCTVDACNESTDACQHVPNDNSCNDGMFCNGTETCDANQGCVSSGPETCDDGIPCTADVCSPVHGACFNIPQNESCTNGSFCDGIEQCDPNIGCTAGVPVDCSDGASCTEDSCDEASDSCVHTPDPDVCDDGLFCNGTETCNGTSCQSGTPPCGPGQSCNEAADQCESTGGFSPMTTASRTSGVAPLGVFFDAADETSGVIQPPVANGRRQYHEYMYEWRFGDPGSGSFATTGRSRNEHIGHLAAHVFAQPGTYTVTLRVTTSSGGIQDYSQTVTVSDPNVVYANPNGNNADNTVYVSPSGNDSNNGSLNNPLRTANAGFDRLFETGARRLLFQRGGVYLCPGFNGGSFEGPLYISAYGSGADPVLEGTTEDAILSANDGDYLTITGLAFRSTYDPTTGYGPHPKCIQMHSYNNFVTVYDNSFTNTGMSMQIGQLAVWQDSVIADNVIYGWQDYGLLTGFMTRVAFIGNSIKQPLDAACCDGKNPDPPEPDFPDHGPMRLREIYKTLVADNDLYSNTGWGANRNAIQPCTRLGSGGYADLSLVTANIMEGGADMSISAPSNGNVLAQIGNVIFERNYMVAMDITKTFVATRMGGYVIRNNTFVHPDTDDHLYRVIYFEEHENISAESHAQVNHVYNNTYASQQTDDDTGYFIEVDAGAVHNVVARNNIWFAPNTGSSNCAFIRWENADINSFSSDNNIFFAPNTNDFIELWGSDMSLADWQSSYGQDQNTTLVDPMLVDVSSGDLRLRTTDDGYPANSPAVDAGESVPSVQIDMEGNPRPVNGSWDIGAYEMGSSGPAVCGNGQLEQGEQCDDGGSNSDAQPDACRTDCTLPGCGDGVIDSGEQCDDGGTTNGDGCSATCQSESGSTDTRYWVGGSGNWSQSSHWAVTSGGSGGASPPAAGDDAVFDAASGSGTVVFNQDISVRDFVVATNASSNLTFDFNERTLTCSRDCLFRRGRIDQGSTQSSTVIVGRNLDTTNCVMTANGSEHNLSVHMVGTGYWRYNLGATGQPRPYQPLIWDLKAAQPGRTTTLRPVGPAPPGIDIDVWNQLILGDQSGLLTHTLQEVTEGSNVTLEIHSHSLDIVATGARIDLTALEHETGSNGSTTLQHNITIVSLNTYDLTGLNEAPAGSGPTWYLGGSIDLATANLSIEKTVVLDTAGHDIRVGTLSVGGGNPGTAELQVRDATITASGRLRISAATGNVGRVYLESGGHVIAHSLSTYESGGFIAGGNGAVVELVGSTPAPTGPVYYVSSSAPGASDSGPGTQSQPFATVQRGLQELNPGVTVLLRSGDSWNLTSGTDINIDGGTLGSYGSGQPPVLRLPAGGQLDFDDNRDDEGAAYDMEIRFGN